MSKARRKTEDVGGLVDIRVVAPQALYHAERVGRPFEELCKLLVVELQSRALRRIRTRLPCGRIRLVGGPSQRGWWPQGGRLGAFTELRMPTMPVGRLLVGMADAEHGRVIEGAAKDLHPKRQAVGAKTITDLRGYAEAMR